ncbi:hypothetical protein [Propionicicella superfundia]|uniref:hypothetical protein n=1 Tax=Propionicicella superfundia TaxID=348582 RepID=UPI000411ADCC|nr:hypothetical protein [Propionicicella superfundia]
MNSTHLARPTDEWKTWGRMVFPRPALVAVLGAIAMIAGGCTATQPSAFPSETPSSPAVASPSPSPSITPVVHVTPSDGDTLLGSLDDQDSSATVGSFRVTGERILVYLTCQGRGIITVQLEQVGGFNGDFTKDCREADPTLSVDSQVDRHAVVDVAVVSAPGQRWAVSVVDPGN